MTKTHAESIKAVPNGLNGGSFFTGDDELTRVRPLGITALQLHYTNFLQYTVQETFHEHRRGLREAKVELSELWFITCHKYKSRTCCQPLNLRTVNSMSTPRSTRYACCGALIILRHRDDNDPAWRRCAVITSIFWWRHVIRAFLTFCCHGFFVS